MAEVSAERTDEKMTEATDILSISRTHSESSEALVKETYKAIISKAQRSAELGRSVNDLGPLTGLFMGGMNRLCRKKPRSCSVKTVRHQ